MEDVGRRDGCFALGGHSPLIVKVIERMRRRDLHVEVGALFTEPLTMTRASLMNSDPALTRLSLDERRRLLRIALARDVERRGEELPPIEPAAREGRLPLSFAQQRLWFLEQMGGLGSTYHVPTHLRLRGELDRAALARALDGMVARHEALRTVFALVDGVPEQRIAPADIGFHLVEHDLGGILPFSARNERGGGRGEGPDAEAELRRLMAEEAGAPFDLERGPLIRGRLIRLAEDDHVLLLTMHHIVSDAWSSGVLTRELSALYEAFHRGEPDPLPPLPVQYADYAAWQRRWVEGEVLQAQADYWTRTLAGAPELLELPTDHPRPARQDFAGAAAGLVLDEELTARLKALSRRHGTTLFMTVLAGWAAVLSRLSGRDDVVVGTPSANRGRREIERLIGFFVNTLALRVDLSGSPTVAELLGRVKTRALEAQQNQDIPFEQVVELVRPARSLAHTPLFQVVLAWQNAPRSGLALPGLRLGAPAGAAAPHVTAKFDLSLALSERDGRIVGGVEYATSLFERDTIERWIGYLRRVLEEMAADERKRVDRLPLIPERERARVLEEWNRTGTAYPGESCIHELFEQQVETRPDAAAVVFEGERLSYAELNARANRLAHHLRALGVGPEVRVALVMARSPELVEAELAVLKCGGVYVPLDPEHPGERLREVLADSAPAALLTTSGVAERFAGVGVPVLALDAGAPAWASHPATNPAVQGVTAEHLAYVMYTSGSTGRPKGVLVPHRAIVRLVVNNGYAAFGADDRVAFAANPAFDAATMDVWAPLVNGGTIVVIGQDTLLDAGRFAMALRTHEVSVLWLTVGLFNRYAEALGDELRRLRYLVVGGDALDPRVIARVLRSGPPAHLLNGYGPTETTTFALTHEIRHVDEGARGIPLGRPISNTHAYLLDRALEPVPVGVAGELCIGGAGVARGYQGRPAQTAERFVPDPWGVPGARLYRTGDLGRWLSDGTIEFLGRTDHQVKVRGFRVEPGEVEARLVEHPGVREAVVLVREDTPGEKRLVAYVAGDGTAGADVLRAYLGERLPAYMVPAAYVHLPALPLTPNGKVDRRALPAPEGGDYARRGYEAPRTETEAALAGLWAELLGVGRVGRHDGFFELGGHSLLAVTLIERMRRQGLHADVRTLFAAPTLAALAAAVVGEPAEVQVPPNRIPPASAVVTPEMLPLVTLGQAQIDAVVATVPGGAANVQDIYPLAPLQEGFLFHHLAAAEGDPYLLATLGSFETRERLDAHLEAFGAVIARHDVLRTAVIWEGLPEPVQVVWREAPLPVEEVEVDPAADDVAGELYRRFDPRHHRIDLRRAPLLRACVARDEARDRWVLLQLQHHLTIDHTALDALRDEIAAHLSGRADALPRPVPFRTFVARARLGVSQEEHRAFFQEMLGDVDEPTAPFGLLDVRGDGSGIAEARVRVEGRLAARLRERARALGVSAATLCHVAWAQVLGRVSGRDDVVFGTVLFGRMQGGEGADRVMGPFINTLPIRIRLGNAGVEASVRQTHALLAKLLRHEHASLPLAQRCSGVEAPAPLFTALLNYRHSGRQTGSNAPAAAASAAPAARTSQGGERTNYPLTLSVDDLGHGFGLTAQAPAPVRPMRVCEMMHAALESLVRALETAPGAALDRVDVLPPAERHRVVEAWNRTEAAAPDETCIHALFAAQVARTPDAVAVIHEGARLTYAELNRRANRLARHLVRLGAGPEARVGVCLERGPELVVSLLAVLKAGAAYLPLDPAYPARRLAYMLADAGAAALVTQETLRSLLEAPPGAAVVSVDGAAAAEIGREDGEDPDAAAAPRNLAYLIYTSGSTGVPKGVAIEHRNTVALLAWAWSVYSREELSGVLASTSVCFDLSVFELFVPLTRGGCAIVVENALALPASAAAGAVRLVNTVPSAIAALLESGGVPAGVRTVCLAGEPLRQEVAEALYARGVERVYDLYGPSEDTTYSTCGLREAGGEPHIGRPIAHTRCYVLDGALRPTPVGVPGELYTGGRGVARGYLGRPRLSAERFVPDPFSPGPGQRMYRTGDRVRWKPDGTLEYLGRLDHQVKIRGFRVEPGEIEGVLRRHPGVDDCAVVVREDGSGGRRLVAYVVGTAGADEARAHLGGTLPEHMVPAAYVRLERLPLTPNGKLDREALPAPAGDAYARRGYEAPAGDTEAALAKIWSEVLRLDRVGRWDHFFQLGGHSLLAVQVVSRARQALEVELALGAVFDHPVLAALAGHVRGLLPTAARHPSRSRPAPAGRTLLDLSAAERLALLELAEATAPARAAARLSPIEPVDRSGPLPLSFAQARLWFMDRMGSDGAAYHIFTGLRLSGALDRVALARALDGMVRRHEALRTTFAEVDGEPVQRIAPAGASRFHLVDHDLGAGDGAGEDLRRIVAEERGAPFSLERGPLVRGRLVRMGPDEHVLLVTMHHIVSDGWSMGVWTTELSALYGAYRRGEPDPLPPLPIQYADYAAWQRTWVDGEVLRRQAEYWRRTLSGAPELLELPADHPRPARHDHRGAFLRWALDEELALALKRLGQRHGTTLFMTLLAGWSVVLGRLSGQEEVMVGMPTANRGRREIEGLIGFFLNTLPLRVELAGSPTVAELLARVKARVLEAQENQDIPFEQVVELVRPVRSLAYAPLFQVSFTWQSAPRGELDLAGLKTAPATGPGVAARAAVRYDLSLTLGEAGGRITGGVEYATSLFHAATVERWLAHLRTVLEEMAADDGRRVDRLPLIPQAERRRLAEEGASHAVARRMRDSVAHAPFAPVEAGRSIAASFRARAAAHPERTAVHAPSGEWSYRALDELAMRIAAAVAALAGCGPGRVGLLFEPGAPMVAGVLGALAAGKTYVPLDPAWPEGRMRQVLDDAAATLVLADRAGHAAALRLAASLRAGPAAVLQVESLEPAGGAGPAVLPEVAPEQLAYLLYTSGSTGEPKGVAQSHRNVLGHIRAYTSALRIGPDDRLTLLASYATDAAVMDLFGALLSGAALHLFDVRRSGVEPLAAWLRSRGITLYHSTPTLFRALLPGGGPPGDRFPSVRLVVLGGEAVTRSDWERFREHFTPGCVFVNGLGPTESTLALQCFMDHSTEPRGHAVPAGHAVEGVEVLLLDDFGEPAEVYARGEIVVRGPHVALGYWGRPGLTAAAFVPDAGGHGARMYRTGDLGRRLPDGTVEFLGRRDHQVKIRGYRVEPDEVAAALGRHPGVREAAVVPRPSGAGGAAVLVAYFVADEPLAPGALRAHLAALLPDPMVPAAYVALAALPLTSSGKLDRGALPAPPANGYPRRGYEAPAGRTEVALAAIWAELLGVERVGRHDHFFELGGHSLLAVQVISRVRRVLGVEVALGEIFQHPALAELARAVEEAARASLPPIEPVDRGRPLPLSFSQQRLWFHERMRGGGAAYHLSVRPRLQGALDRAALRRALERIVARHEALRTVFRERAGVAEQRIAPAEAASFHLVEHDLAGAPGGPDELRRLMTEAVRARFDLERGPLIRGHLIRIGADDHVLLVTLHHIVSDAWSMGVLTRELGTLYAAFSRGEPDPLPPLAVQYADYAAWQRRWVEGEVLRRQAEYWGAALAGAPELLELPVDRPRPAVRDDAGGSLGVGVVLGEELTAGLKELSRRHGATLFMTLLAGWAAVLSRLSGQDDVVVGTPTANRGRAEIEGLIGFFVNTLALRVDLSDTPTVAELLGRVKARALEAQANQDIPFEKVVERVRPARSLAHTPLFQVMFAWQNAPRGALELPGLAPAPLERPARMATQFDLSLTLFEWDGKIAGGMEYAAALFDASTVTRSLEYLRRVLEGMVADDRQPVGSLPLLPQAERARLLDESRGPSVAWGAEACIHELFEARAGLTPSAPAVVLGAAALTYAQLDRRAEAVASALAARGIGRGGHVPIVMERGLGVPVAMLGVMKSGAAFSPLDPRWPAARLRQVLDDLGCEVVLVDGAPPFGEAELGRTFLAVPGADDSVAGDGEDDRARGARGEESGEVPRERSRAPRSPDDPIYVIYTSGSTGTPKGVLVPHRGIANRFRWMSGHFGAEAAGVVLQTTRHVYDSAVWQLFWPLTLGGRSVMLAGDEELAAGPVAALVRRHGVTMTDFVPSVFNELVPRLVDDAEARSALASLRAVVVGGEQITPGTTYAFVERFPGVRVVNLYGPTEASIGCICHEVTGREGDRIPIGRPIANTHALVLDGGRGLVPAGVAGELYLSGACLGLGYLNDAEKTRAAFVDNPFPELGSERMYRTGDRVRRLAGGEIEFLGRVDQQVKIRGFRIEPGEIEAALLRHPGVREALVLAREAAPGEPRLVGYVVAAGEEGVAADALRAHLGARLPDYMVPGAWVVLERFPRTPGGKVDRGALPAPAWEAGAAYVAPRTPEEEIVAGIWAEVLGRERVGAHDGFFDLGGHSLLAMRVIARLGEAFGAELPLRAIFECPTVAALAERVRAAVSATEGPPPLPLRAVPRDGRLALSFGQERLWSAWRSDPRSPSYNLHYRVRLRGALDARVLERALAEVVRRHESLRTTFREEDGRAVQVIHPASPALLRQVELGGLPQAAREQAVASLGAGETHRPFHLERGPLFRAVLARMGEGDFALFLTLHHIVSDGWSTGVLMREISTLYAAFAAGEGSPLPEPEVQYADYAAWQRAWFTGEALDRQLDYWRGRLAGAPALNLRVDRPRSPRGGDPAAARSFHLPDELSAALRELSRREECTVYMTLLAGFQALLSRHAGHADISVGTPVAGRVRRELEDLVGFFSNTLVIRTDLSGAPGFRGVLACVREAALGAFAHQDFPFARLVSALRPDCGPGEMPLFQVVFELEHARARPERLRLSSVEVTPLGRSPGDRGTLRSEMRLTMTDHGTRIGGTLAYRTELFDPATIERMIAEYLALLHAAAADPDRPVAALLPSPPSNEDPERTRATVQPV